MIIHLKTLLQLIFISPKYKIEITFSLSFSTHSGTNTSYITQIVITVQSSTKPQLIFQPVDLCLQRHQLTLDLLCSGVGLTYLMQNGQVLVGPNIQSSLKW